MPGMCTDIRLGASPEVLTSGVNQEERRMELVARYGSEDDVPLSEWDAEEFRRVNPGAGGEGEP